MCNAGLALVVRMHWTKKRLIQAMGPKTLLLLLWFVHLWLMLLHNVADLFCYRGLQTYCSIPRTQAALAVHVATLRGYVNCWQNTPMTVLVLSALNQGQNLLQIWICSLWFTDIKVNHGSEKLAQLSNIARLSSWWMRWCKVFARWIMIGC